MQTLHHEKSSVKFLFQRAAAYLLDMALLFLVLAPVGGLIQWAFFDSLPQTGPEIWRTLLWNFSVPVWLYFILCDSSSRGATLGKRPFRLKVVDMENHPLSKSQALLRTAVKLLPWELVHVSAFALSVDMSVLSGVQMAGLIGANVLVIVYAVVLAARRGQRTIHDFAARTKVVRDERSRVSHRERMVVGNTAGG